MQTDLQPTAFESLNTIMLHIYALHKERDDYPPPIDIQVAIDRVHSYLLGNG
jgi:hypothetical protein